MTVVQWRSWLAELGKGTLCLVHSLVRHSRVTFVVVLQIVEKQVLPSWSKRRELCIPWNKTSLQNIQPGVQSRCVVVSRSKKRSLWREECQKLKPKRAATSCAESILWDSFVDCCSVLSTLVRRVAVSKGTWKLKIRTHCVGRRYGRAYCSERFFRGYRASTKRQFWPISNVLKNTVGRSYHSGLRAPLVFNTPCSWPCTLSQWPDLHWRWRGFEVARA